MGVIVELNAPRNNGSQTCAPNDGKYKAEVHLANWSLCSLLCTPQTSMPPPAGLLSIAYSYHRICEKGAGPSDQMDCFPLVSQFRDRLVTPLCLPDVVATQTTAQSQPQLYV